MPHKTTKSTTKTTATKRTGSFSNSASKKRKLTSGKATPNTAKGKQRAYERATIPLPDVPDDEQDGLSDQDMEFFKDNPMISFLDKLDQHGIARSKKEANRLHEMSKPQRLRPTTDDLPSLDSHDEDGDDWSDGIDNSGLDLGEDKTDDEVDDLSSSPSLPQEMDFNAEQPYERKPRTQGVSWDAAEADIVPRLPIKLPNGQIVKTAGRVIPQAGSQGDEDEGRSPQQEQNHASKIEDVSTGARFGRPAVAQVLSTSSRKVRIQMAKEQIAGICQDILADPEGSLGLLRRLHTFSLTQISSPQSPVPVPNDPLIRRLAMISQLAILKDIIPGYRIRPLTDAEKAEKVSQMVSKTREWEQGLVGIYQTYLRALEAELKGKTEFAGLALKSMCTLLTEATHFNFRTNLISTVVMRLSKKSWDQSSDLCLQTLITIFKQDSTGLPSLEVVRLLNRMVKERKFNVHPNALSCLLHLRLKTELGGVRASETKANKDELKKPKWESRSKADRKRAKGRKVERPHFSKKTVKALKERKEIEAQMQEAEAEVDREEKTNMQTETLKLLFVLYFHILKAPRWTPLLPAALQGLSRYAHMVNIDFFKDLMQVLKDLIIRTPDDGTSEEPEVVNSASLHGDPTARHRLLCVVTAFELLSGQGEALNIDLRDFINHLYGLILPIASQPNAEATVHEHTAAGKNGVVTDHATSDLLFRALALVFPERSSAAGSLIRKAAFAKRMLMASLVFPAPTALRSIEFVRNLLVKEPRLHALLSTEDRTADGIYRPELDDPELSNPFGTSFWELDHLRETHWDSKVRDKARELARFTGM